MLLALKILKGLRNHEPAADARLEVINAFLLSIKRAADLANLEPKDPSLPPSTNPKTINIFPKELQYLSATKAETHLRRVQAAHNQDPTAEQFTNAELDVEIQERGKLTEFMHDTFRRRKGNVNLAVTMGLAPWTNFAAADQAGWTEGGLSEAQRRKLWEEHETPGNVIVVKWEDNVMTIYDPSWSTNSRTYYRDGKVLRLREISGWSLVAALRTAINKQGTNVRLIQGGGGGNHHGESRRMSYRWLVEEVIAAIEPAAAKPVRCTDWVKIVA
ncbi:hypothetical protein V499_04368 [Pseudogymnoascus sp. VKM F-103]|nr:hypothetical protein V499_04368 [Pseudogymnoascus sp. VKM F-103]